MKLANLQKLISPLADGGARGAMLTIDGEDVPVSFRRNGRARRIILRIDRRGDGVVLTLPPGVRRGEALEFAASHAAWIRAHLQKRIDRILFEPGALAPLRGELCLIEHRPVGRGGVWLEERAAGAPPALCVTGEGPHVARRVRDWLKRQARSDLMKACAHYSAQMDLSYRRITVRDQSSRWGSCSTNGTLSFSWRLVMAPPDILDYVAAHEVAHLREMNHSAKFWSLVEAHCAHARASRRWLKSHGANLHRYGE